MVYNLRVKLLATFFVYPRHLRISVAQPARVDVVDLPTTMITVGDNGTQVSFSAWANASDQDLGDTRTFSVAVFGSASSGDHIQQYPPLEPVHNIRLVRAAPNRQQSLSTSLFPSASARSDAVGMQGDPFGRENPVRAPRVARRRYSCLRHHVRLKELNWTCTLHLAHLPPSPAFKHSTQLEVRHARGTPHAVLLFFFLPHCYVS